jgi:hypothetical protein
MQKTASSDLAGRATPGILRPIAGITLLLLAAQFLIGMVVNLYVQIPSVHSGANAPDYFVGVVQGVVWALGHGTWALVIHVVLGLLLVLASFLLIGFSIAARRRGWIILSVLGWIGVMGAGFNGASFLNYGHDFSSLLMSIGFLLATISYTIGFSRGRNV